MYGLLKEFQAFALRGNAVDLAVAVIIGAAFGKIVSSAVDNLIMPVISIVLGIVNLSVLKLTIGASVIQYGIFLQSVLDFVLITLVIFLIIKLINRYKRTQAEELETSAKPSEDIMLLREILEALQKSR